MGPDAFSSLHRSESIKHVGQRGFIPRDKEARARFKTSRACSLMLIARFAERSLAWKYENGLPALEATENGSHSNMRDDDVSAIEKCRCFVRRDKRRLVESREIDGCSTVLEENIAHPARTRPVSDRSNKSIERELRTNGDENQTTAPA
jgi:hypothetical protein